MQNDQQQATPYRTLYYSVHNSNDYKSCLTAAIYGHPPEGLARSSTLRVKDYNRLPFRSTQQPKTVLSRLTTVLARLYHRAESGLGLYV